MLISLTLAGCTASSGHAPVPAATEPAPNYTSPDGQARLLADGSMTLPLDSYDGFASADDQSLLAQAVTAVEQRCMHAKGFTLPQGFAEQFIPSPTPPLDLYGVATMAEATTYGYRLPDPSTASSAPPAVPTPALSAFYGSADGTGGCKDEAFQQLDFATSTAAFGFVQNLREQALKGVVASPEMATADAAWSSCMAEAGYHYQNPIQPEQDLALLSGSTAAPPSHELPPTTPGEKKAAVADVHCKYRTNWLQQFTQAADQYQEQQIARNREHLEQIRVQWTADLAKARTVAGQPEQGGSAATAAEQ